MTEKLYEKMKEEVLKLPKENQVAINSFDWATEVEKICNKYQLRSTEINDVQTETGIFLLGLADFELFIINLEATGLTNSESAGIAREIMEKVFTPIGEKIETLIKGDLKNQIVRWDQSVNFIVSGGDYSNFILKQKNG